MYMNSQFVLFFQQLTVLIKDSLDPNKFKDVLVVKTEERHARLQAKSSKRPAIALLNAILTCVFTKAELAVSSGLGIRKMKGEVGCPLDGTKIEAIRGNLNISILFFYTYM